jgi:hypothetical protein
MRALRFRLQMTREKAPGRVAKAIDDMRVRAS